MAVNNTDGSAAKQPTSPPKFAVPSIIPAVPLTVPAALSAPITAFPSTKSTTVPSSAKSETLPAARNSPDLKRKRTDPNLKIVTVDPFYDLTIIVGTDYLDGQVAFRVNKGSMRHASDVWTKMLTDLWAKLNSEPEIRFPDDSPWAFEQVLRIAHLQIDIEPSALSLSEVEALAILSDKYNLVKLMRIAINSKGGFSSAQVSEWHQWPAEPSLQVWTFITYAFHFQDDYDYLVNKLAVEAQVDEADMSLYHVTGDKKTRLRSDLPDRILNEIHHIRTSIIQEWIIICSIAVDEAILKKDDHTLSVCGKAICRRTRVGIMITDLRAAGFYPTPKSAETMYQNVTWYWSAIKNMGAEFRKYSPCDGAMGFGKGNHRSTCSFTSCFGDFGIVTEARATLTHYGHQDVVSHLLRENFTKNSG